MTKNDLLREIPKPISVLFTMDAMHGGGAEKVLSDLFAKLDRGRFRADLFVFTRCGIYLSKLPPDVRVFALFEDPERFRGVQKFCRLAMRSVFIRLARKFPSLMGLAARLAGIRETFDVGVSFCEGLNLLLLTGAGALFRRRIAWVHTNMAQHKFVLGAAQFAAAAQSADKIVFVAKSAMQVFQGLFPHIPAAKLLQIYNPVDVAEIRSKAALQGSTANADVPPSGRTENAGAPAVILAVGRLENVKRFDRLIDAFKLVRTRGVSARLVILGSGGGLAALQGHAEACGVREDVEFLPFSENPYAVMARADLLVSSSDYEGLPIVITEAMALGKPIVATRTTGATEILENGTYGLLADFSPESLADAICRMLLSEETRNRYLNALDAARMGNSFAFSSSIAEIERLLAEKPVS